MDKALLDQLLAEREAHRAVAVVTDLGAGTQRLVRLSDIGGEPELADALAEAFSGDKSGTVETDAGEQFIHVFNPPLKMIIVGAVHVAQALVPIAEATGYEVTIIDPRGAFATEQRFPGVRLIEEWPDEVLPSLGVDQRTAFIALTHDPKIDDPALSFALDAPCFYIGALGSRRTHAARLERLSASGDKLDRIHGPIGLNIGARGAPEIAISIMAEVTGALRQGAGGAK